MRFWDSSALVPVLVDEAASDRVRALLAADPGIVAWALTPLEVRSGLWRRFRRGELPEAGRVSCGHRLDAMVPGWQQVADVPGVVARASDLLSRHDLRAGDAAQLAAALEAVTGAAAEIPFVTLDDRLAAAARAEGFRVLP